MGLSHLMLCPSTRHFIAQLYLGTWLILEVNLRWTCLLSRRCRWLSSASHHGKQWWTPSLWRLSEWFFEILTQLWFSHFWKGNAHYIAEFSMVGRSNVVQPITWKPLLTRISNTNYMYWVRHTMYMYLYLAYKVTTDTQILADQ